jgi:IS5 family transposase
MKVSRAGWKYLARGPRLIGESDKTTERTETPMRQIIHQQTALGPAIIKHSHADELKKISEVLDQLPQAAQLVHASLVHPKTKRLGRKGMSAEQVLRAMLIKQMNGFSYEELAFHLADSNVYRWFCRLGIGDKPPSRSTLQKGIKRVQAETWDAINRLLVHYAVEHKIERGDKIRTDCTAVETNIHHPNDSSLLWDCVRVLTRLLHVARDQFGLAFNDHSRRARRRTQGIAFAKSAPARLPLYRDLIKVTGRTVGQAKLVTEQLGKLDLDFMQALKAQGLATELGEYVAMAEKVISQTERRVLQGESVPAAEKLLSIFEPHTDIIVKDNRQPIYGHKICLTAGASSLVTDVVVEKGNPADVTLAVEMINRQKEIFGKAPRQASFDGGFASRENLTVIKKLGVSDVAFSKRVGLQITDMVKSAWVYRRLRDFRSGLEGIISFLKRGFGLARCAWKGFPSFKAYVTASVLSCNLLIVARHLIAAA